MRKHMFLIILIFISLIFISCGPGGGEETHVGYTFPADGNNTWYINVAEKINGAIAMTDDNNTGVENIIDNKLTDEWKLTPNKYTTIKFKYNFRLEGFAISTNRAQSIIVGANPDILVEFSENCKDYNVSQATTNSPGIACNQAGQSAGGNDGVYCLFRDTNVTAQCMRFKSTRKTYGIYDVKVIAY